MSIKKWTKTQKITLLVVVLVGFWLVFLDKTSIRTHWILNKKIQLLNNQLLYLKAQTEEIKKEYKIISTDSNVLIKYAREQFFMKKNDEEIFIIEYFKEEED